MLVDKMVSMVVLRTTARVPPSVKSLQFINNFKFLNTLKVLKILNIICLPNNYYY